ncbi:MAG TPA: hypothetical protein VJ246_00135 [Patescibacteria group bacterium]|nr:hypothetical protein [Patescibacteria group bacterium]
MSKTETLSNEAVYAAMQEVRTLLAQGEVGTVVARAQRDPIFDAALTMVSERNTRIMAEQAKKYDLTRGLIN